MSQQALHYDSSPQQRGHFVRNASWIAFGTIIAVNVAMLALANHDRYWLAIAIGTVLGPAINLFFGLLGLMFVPWIRRAAGGGSTSAYVLVVVVTPTVGAIVDYVAVRSMDISGC